LQSPHLAVTDETEEVKPKPSAVTLIDIPTITLTTEDEGRKVGNDAIPIIFILGKSYDCF